MSSTPRSPDARGPRGRAGFTLMELLVAMTIGGILVTIVFQLLQGNSRFVRAQSAREEVQQNGRAALELIVGELRGVPPGALRMMQRDSVRFYLPRAWGVTCTPVTSASSSVWALFPTGAFPAADFKAGRPEWGVALDSTANPSLSTGRWRFVAAVAKIPTAGSCAALQPSVGPQHEVVGFSGNAGRFMAGGTTLVPGTQLLAFEEVKYDVKNSTSEEIPGYWIRRMAGRDAAGRENMQPMAGPLPGVEGLEFRYYRADGVTETTVPAEVQRIRVRVVTQSRSMEMRGGVLQPVQVDTVSSTVFLRN